MNTHETVLQETKDLQQASLDSVQRMRHMASESKRLAGTALQDLHEQGTRLQRLEASTIKHNEKLTVSSKLQDKFARAKFHFGTNTKAKKDIRKEKKLEDKLNAAMPKDTPTFKRRGPRPKKAPMEDPSRNELFSNHTVSKERNERVANDRRELFSNRLDRRKSMEKAPLGERCAPLTAQEKQELGKIQETDDLLEQGLDALGEDVSDMLAQATLMGTVVQDHNHKLDRIQKTMEDSKWKTKEVQNRLGRLSKQKPKRKKKHPIRKTLLRSVSPI